MLNDIPLGINNTFLNDLYYKNGVFISFLGIISSLGMIKIQKKVVSTIFFILLLALKLITTDDWKNSVIMEINEGKKIENFQNPFLSCNMKISPNKVVYKFNDYLMGYEELVFEPNHGLNPDIDEIKNNAAFKKIYNQNWYWYINLD
ncbi:MAG: hypothetical protein EAZ97_06620 [Bacteroidetes bacterium]|nr:MAG: hypothetical protein EAZ97_06620 [Bacteroidota bacterium]